MMNENNAVQATHTEPYLIKIAIPITGDIESSPFLLTLMDNPPSLHRQGKAWQLYAEHENEKECLQKISFKLKGNKTEEFFETTIPLPDALLMPINTAFLLGNDVSFSISEDYKILYAQISPNKVEKRTDAIIYELHRSCQYNLKNYMEEEEKKQRKN